MHYFRNIFIQVLIYHEGKTHDPHSLAQKEVEPKGAYSVYADLVSSLEARKKENKGAQRIK